MKHPREWDSMTIHLETLYRTMAIEYYFSFSHVYSLLFTSGETVIRGLDMNLNTHVWTGYGGLTDLFLLVYFYLYFNLFFYFPFSFSLLLGGI